MADTSTTNFSFTLPEPGASDDTWGVKLNANWTAADTAIFARALKTTAITASTGLTGGGDLSASRSLALTGQALAIHNLATNGQIVRTGAATFATRTLTAGTGITVANGDGVSGNPTPALTGQALALHNLASNGIIVRTGSGTVTNRSVAAGDGIGVTNGDGVAGNPSVAVDSTVVRTTGTQTLTANYTLSGAPVFSGAPSFTGSPSFAGAANKATIRSDLGLGNAATATVQSSVTDETASRLLTVGAFGLGSTGRTYTNTDDYNTLPKIVQMLGNGSTTNPANAPVSGERLVGMSNYINAQRGMQMLASAVTGHLYTRVDDNGTWSGWARQVSTLNLLGTVSQSSGIPTGAVIERGTNANGEYVRFADGTQICTHSVNIGSPVYAGSGTYSAPYTTNSATMVFPAAFIATPSASFMNTVAGGTLNSRMFTPSMSAITASQITLYRAVRVNSDADTSDVTVRYMAIGRWF